MAKRQYSAVPKRADGDDISTLDGAVNVLRAVRDCPRRRCSAAVVRRIDDAVALMRMVCDSLEDDVHPPRIPPAALAGVRLEDHG